MSVAQQTRPTRSEWEARAVELAVEQHLTGTARLLAENETRRFYGIRKSGPTGEYLVRAEFWHGGELRSVSCDCVAGQYNRPCKHSGAVLHAEQVRARALATTHDDAWSWWMKGGEW